MRAGRGRDASSSFESHARAAPTTSIRRLFENELRGVLLTLESLPCAEERERLFSLSLSLSLVCEGEISFFRQLLKLSCVGGAQGDGARERLTSIARRG